MSKFDKISSIDLSPYENKPFTYYNLGLLPGFVLTRVMLENAQVAQRQYEEKKSRSCYNSGGHGKQKGGVGDAYGTIFHPGGASVLSLTEEQIQRLAARSEKADDKDKKPPKPPRPNIPIGRIAIAAEF